MKKPALNKKQCEHARKCLRRIINKFGTGAALARELGISPQMVDTWLHGQTRNGKKENPPIAVRHVIKLCHISGGSIKEADLRPDVFYRFEF